MIWIVLLILCVVAVMVVLWPLSGSVETPADADIVFFHSQTARIAADVQRQLLGTEEAEEARLMAARLLLHNKSSALSENHEPNRALTRRKWTALGCLCVIPIVAFGLYGKLGDPRFGADAPAPIGQDASAMQDPMVVAVEKIEAHLKAVPEDGRGYEVLVAAYSRLGRRDDAVHAAQKALELLGETADREAVLAEALTFAADGKVTEAARQSIDRALSLNPQSPMAVYYQAVGAVQDGFPDKARDILANLLASSPVDAPWRPSIERFISQLSASGNDKPPELPATSLPMIENMVAGLAEKLKKNPDNIEGWLRLIRSYSVLHRGDEARAALQQAQAQFVAQPQQVQRLKALAVEQGLGD